MSKIGYAILAFILMFLTLASLFLILQKASLPIRNNWDWAGLIAGIFCSIGFTFMSYRLHKEVKEKFK